MTDTTPQMTTTDLYATIKAVINTMQLGSASVRVSSTYTDYVALEIACFADRYSTAAVSDHFKALCARHGWDWTMCHVTAFLGHNRIVVLLGKSQFISSADVRMPELRTETASI